MTNPNNAVGTNAAYNGRTSVNAFNDGLAGYSRGILSGWACAPSSGLNVVLGGDGTTRDVAIAMDSAGNKTTINNISGSPVSVSIAAAPTANSRIDAIVAYVDNPPQGSNAIADNYEACGLISVMGNTSASPVAPNDSMIRSAITADGASGATAYYVILATISVAAGTTDITSSDIESGAVSALSAGIPAGSINSKQIADGAIVTDKLADSSVTSDKIDFGTLLTNPKFIQTGVASINYQVQGSGGGEVNVVFSTAFDNPPAVILQPFGLFTAYAIEAHVGNRITTTGFNMLGRTASNAQETGSVRWIAFDITKLSLTSN